MIFNNNFYYKLPINVPSLNTRHLNCCFEGIEHTSLLLLISLIYKYDFNVEPYIIMPDISPPKNNPLSISPITRDEKNAGIHDSDFLINRSNAIYEIKNARTP